MEYLCERCLRDDAIHKRDTVCLPVLEVGVDQLLVLRVILDREVKQVEGKAQFLLAVEHFKQRFLGRALFGKTLDGLHDETQYDIGIDSPVGLVQHQLHLLEGVV